MTSSPKPFTGVEKIWHQHEVGPLSDQQLREFFNSGWRFNPKDQTWHKLWLANDGAPETPALLQRHNG